MSATKPSEGVKDMEFGQCFTVPFAGRLFAEL